MSKSHTNKKMIGVLKTPEQKKRNSERVKKWWAERRKVIKNQPKITKYPAEINLRKGRKGKLHKNWGMGESVVQLDISSNFIADHLSASEAARSIKIENARSNIIKVCDNKIPTAYGFRWKYKKVYYENRDTVISDSEIPSICRLDN